MRSEKFEVRSEKLGTGDRGQETGNRRGGRLVAAGGAGERRRDWWGGAAVGAADEVAPGRRHPEHRGDNECGEDSSRKNLRWLFDLIYFDYIQNK